LKKNILIIGGSGHLGSFLVNNLISSNNLIVLSKRKKINLKKKEKNLKFYYCDLLKEKSVINVTKKIKSRYKKIDVLIFVSAIHGKIATFDKISLKEYKKIFQINFFSFLEIIKIFLNHLKKSKNASIIVFSGGGVTFQRPLFSGYSCSKISLIKFIEVISYEIKKFKININAIAPGIMDSKLFRETRKYENKKNIKFVEKIKILNLINFLIEKKNKNITGKLLSAQWDNINNLKKNNRFTDIYTLKRVTKKLKK
tara:strand:- start:9634 stop:10398 length:765 start_codon:yes stop_codon:yes gene_type:complete